jgi:phosphomannomutase/phosphomannomutase/phosphoglucomutase
MPAVKVVLDCGNGAAGCVARRLYEGVGLKPVILFEEPDGRFPNHHPDPTVEKNLDALKKAVKEHGAAIGIGFDGDADRIGIVDQNGRFVPGDEMMVVISRGVLEKNPGAKIIGDVKCSDRLYDDIKQHGGQPIMWKTGHSLVKNKIKEEKAPFGGELSGHVFFADRNYGYDDALYAGLRLVEQIGTSGKSIQDLLAGFPPAYNTPEIRIDTTEDKKRAIVEKLRSLYGNGGSEYKSNLIDGIRISYKDGWALARASNTQPVLVLRFESTTQEGLKRIQGEIESIVQPML